jgi:hypothetical protein
VYLADIKLLLWESSKQQNLYTPLYPQVATSSKKFVSSLAASSMSSDIPALISRTTLGSEVLDDPPLLLEVQLVLRSMLPYEDHNFEEDTKSLRLGR